MDQKRTPNSPGDGLPTQANRNRGKRPGTAAYPFLSPAVERDELGRLGNYRVLRLLGQGGMGMVFLAEDIALRCPVALKVIKPDVNSANDQAWKRFLREARAMAAIKHDHLVTVYQVGQDGETIYLAMEFLEGETLDSWIGRVEEPSLAEMLRVAREIATGLDAIHERGLIHRDIKPANIWLETRAPGSGVRSQGSGAKGPGGEKPAPPRVKILDFGLARDAKDNTQLTRSGTILGTPAFLSPEQARGKPAEAQSDLFSLGCVLYCMCTKKAPFAAENTMAQLAALVADEPVPVQELNPQIPEALAELVMQLLAKEPGDRPESAAAVAQRLLEIRRSLTKGRKKPLTNSTRRIKSKKDTGESTQMLSGISLVQRHWGKGLAALGGAVLVILAVVGAVNLLSGRPEAKEPPENKGTQVVQLPNPSPKKTEVVPPPPDKQPDVGEKVFLKDLKMVDSVNWPFHKMDGADKKPPKGKDDKKPPDGKEDFEKKGPPPEISGPVTAHGKLSPHGIWMHPAPPHFSPASITYSLGKQYQTFSAKATLNDSSRQSPSALTFAVYGDGKLLWDFKGLVDQSQAQDCNISVQGVDLLKLEVRADGDVRKAHAVWVEPFVGK